MIAYEAIALMVIAFVVVALGRPVAQAYSEKLKKTLSQEQATKLQERISALEEEIRQLRQQLAAVQESTDFALQFIDPTAAKKNSSDNSSKTQNANLHRSA
ncbi:MAG TPA: hypothetical protein V6C72_10080 [Chroococcales cyanobacterium]